MAIRIETIRAAADLLDGVVVKTPLLASRKLSERFAADIYLKLENLQVTGSFKDRGAYVKLHGLSAAEKKAGVIAASAGNHAQGVAYHARNLGISARIVMPVGTPFIKQEQTSRFGAEILLHGETVGEAADYATACAAKEGLVFVHPYDDAQIIAGQGTIALEMLAEIDLDILILPIGGGGLIAGNAIAARAMRPEIAIYGVEAANFSSMHAALHGLEEPAGGATLAEGIAIKRPGKLTEPIVRELVKEVLLAEEEAIERAVDALLMTEKILAEGAGAIALAGLEQLGKKIKGKKIGLVVSGGNIDARVLSSILLRGLAREGRLIRLRVETLDQPGILSRLTGLIAEMGGNIIEIEHHRLFYDVPVRFAELDLVIETRNSGHAAEIVSNVSSSGFTSRLLSSRAGGGRVEDPAGGGPVDAGDGEGP